MHHTTAPSPRVTSTSYSRPYRPRVIAAANAAGRALTRLGLEPTDLAERGLLAAARRTTGLDDYGDARFRPALQQLLRSIEHEARLHPVGRAMTRQSLVRVLGNRLRIVHALRRHPEIGALSLERPLFIVGLQRTGTTLLHRMLARDPELRHLASWEAIHPAPLPSPSRRLAARVGLDGYDPRPPSVGRDRRVAAAELAERALSFMAPDFFAIHPVQAHAPEEDCLLFDHTFHSTVFEATQRLPGFSRWLEHQEHGWAYAEYRDTLRYLSWQRPPGSWVLKTPQHMEHLELLVRTFPDARIIQPHRDPVRAVSSLCSMLSHGWGVFSDHVDPTEVGRLWGGKVMRMTDACLAARERLPAEPFLDVSYYDLVSDPLAQVRRIYAWLERPLTPQLERRLAVWCRGNPRHKHGVHRYRLEDFGLDRDAVEERFAPYRRRFAIPVEA